MEKIYKHPLYAAADILPLIRKQMPDTHARLYLKYVEFGLKSLKELFKEFARVRGDLQVDVRTSADSANFYQPSYEEVSTFIYDQLASGAAEFNIRFLFFPLKVPRSVEKMGFVYDGRAWERTLGITLNEFSFEVAAFIEQEE